MQQLLDAGADAKVLSKAKKSALDVAKESGNAAVAKLLLPDVPKVVKQPTPLQLKLGKDLAVASKVDKFAKTLAANAKKQKVDHFNVKQHIDAMKRPELVESLTILGYMRLPVRTERP